MAKDEKKRKKEKNPQPQLPSTTGEEVKIKNKKKKQRPSPPVEQEPSGYMTNKREKNNVSSKENKKKKQRKEANGSSEIYDGDDDAKQLGEKDYEGSNNQKDKKKRKNRTITDSRFAAAQFDPRFQRMPKRESKVVIDSRFTRMFSDKNFESSAAPVDKRGKRKGQAVNPLLHYYLHQEDKEEEEEEEQALVEEEGSDGVQSEMDVSAEDIEKGTDDSDVEERSIASSRSDEDSSTDDEDIEDDDDQSVNSDIWRYLLASHEDTPVTDTETHRLAVVNMDWDHIKAVDLYVVMSSCLPKGGQILSVTIYPSEYGLKCMEIEAVSGPSGLIDDSNEDGEGSSDIENEKLRTYELNKLRYYYAVAICDSVDTASHIYRTLDGTELLESSNVFDLRFIPDSMEFKYPPRDEAKEAPASYKEPEFRTRALQHSKVKLTWEEDEPERKKILRRKFNPDQLDELNEYLASSGDSDDEDNDEENNDLSVLKNGEGKKRKRAEELRALLLSGNDSDGEKSDKDMEITFNTELEELSKRILEKKDKKSETVWEAVLRKRSEKKKARKRSKHSEDDSSDYDIEEAPTGDFFDEEPSDTETNVAKKKGNAPSKKRRKDNAGNNDLRDIEKEQEASRAELELLLAEDQGSIQGPKGYNLKHKKGKNKKAKKVTLEDKLPDVDVSNDPRFSALFASHLYALDPTDPQYKRSAAFARQRVKKQKNGAEPEAPLEDSKFNTSEQVNNAVPGKEDVMATTESLAGGNDDFFSTIRSLKRNVGTLNNQPKGR